MDLNSRMRRFRLASRSLFNGFFAVEDPWNNQDVAWASLMNFQSVEDALFQSLVAVPCQLAGSQRYGTHNPAIAVNIVSDSVPIMLNRDVDSGYWDYPITQIDKAAAATFVRFFDWSALDFQDYQYVHVVIGKWPLHHEAEGKHGLIETRYVTYSKAAV